MNITQTIPTFLVPVLTLIVPGIALLPWFPRIGILATAARIILWSICITTITTLIFTYTGIPLWTFLPISLAVAALLLFKQRKELESPRLWLYAISISFFFFLFFFLFSIPFLFTQSGLPTGDSQKSIYWANEIIETGQPARYSQSFERLNRDPVDFYTPGLHSLTAYIMTLTPNTSLTAVGFFSIAAALAVAIIAAAIPRELFHNRTSFYMAALTVLFLLTQIRFLRYIREPGYHFQNLIGELLLFGFILLVISLTHHFRWFDAILLVAIALSLAFSHQFSAFILAIITVPLALLFLITRRRMLMHRIKRHPIIVLGLAIALLVLLLAGVGLGLHQKVPHIFTTTPHLLPLVPTLGEYLTLMGPVWMISGIAGAVLLLQYATNKKTYQAHTIVFIVITGVLLLLSQGPRLGIDIPPVRALFYSAVPLSITAAYFFTRLFAVSRQMQGTTSKVIAQIILTLLILVPTTSSLASAYPSSPQVRTNSTLTPAQTLLIERMSQVPEGRILIDDYNRRSASWLLLSGNPMVTRIAADLERQMKEAAQSTTRYELYLKQLEYEKIFALGSLPDISSLLEKNDITYLTGIAGKSQDAFDKNPALSTVTSAADISIYDAPQATTTTGQPDSVTQWLLRPSTLANDIGDGEDTFEHLQASIRSSRISEPLSDQQTTYRVSSAPEIPLTFNVGDYTRILWDKENTDEPDTDVELYIRFVTDNNPRTILTPDRHTHQLTPGNEPIRIPANQVAFNEEGFITITLLNPSAQPVAIDLIALGLARIP